MNDPVHDRVAFATDKRIDVLNDGLDRKARVLEYNGTRYLAWHTFKQIASEPFLCGHDRSFAPIGCLFASRRLCLFVTVVRHDAPRTRQARPPTRRAGCAVRRALPSQLSDVIL